MYQRRGCLLRKRKTENGDDDSGLPGLCAPKKFRNDEHILSREIQLQYVDLTRRAEADGDSMGAGAAKSECESPEMDVLAAEAKYH